MRTFRFTSPIWNCPQCANRRIKITTITCSVKWLWSSGSQTSRTSRKRTDSSHISRKGKLFCINLHAISVICVTSIDDHQHRILLRSTTPNEENAESELRRVSVTQNSNDSTLLSPESAMSQQDGQNQEDSTVSALMLVRDVLYGNRDNVNFVHELYRQAFLLDFNHAGAIRKAIAVYKDWIQMNVSFLSVKLHLSNINYHYYVFFFIITFFFYTLQEIPPFMLEPLDGHKERDLEEYQRYEMEKFPSDTYRQTRLRNDSYLGAIHRENLFIRAGLQNVLQIFITQASNVFFLENSGPNASPTLLEEQTDSCKRVLNVYRYVVMHSRLEPATWEQLLRYVCDLLCSYYFSFFFNNQFKLLSRSECCCKLRRLYWARNPPAASITKPSVGSSRLPYFRL